MRPSKIIGMDGEAYLVCDLCGEIMLLDDAFAFADERMLVCRTCTTPEFWTASTGPSDGRDEDASRF